MASATGQASGLPLPVTPLYWPSSSYCFSATGGWSPSRSLPDLESVHFPTAQVSYVAWGAPKFVVSRSQLFLFNKKLKIFALYIKRYYLCENKFISSKPLKRPEPWEKQKS